MTLERVDEQAFWCLKHRAAKTNPLLGSRCAVSMATLESLVEVEDWCLFVPATITYYAHAGSEYG